MSKRSRSEDSEDAFQAVKCSKPDVVSVCSESSDDEVQEGLTDAQVNSFKLLDARISTSIEKMLREEHINMNLRAAYTHTRLFRMGARSVAQVKQRPAAKPRTGIVGLSRVQRLHQLFPKAFAKAYADCKATPKDNECIEYVVKQRQHTGKGAASRPMIWIGSKQVPDAAWEAAELGARSFLRAVIIAYATASDELKMADLSDYDASHICHNQRCVCLAHIVLELARINRQREKCRREGRCSCEGSVPCIILKKSE